MKKNIDFGAILNNEKYASNLYHLITIFIITIFKN